MAEQTDRQLNEQEQAEWTRSAYQKALKHLAEKGVIASQITLEESRVLPPLVAIWKLSAQVPAVRKYWAISGDLPADVATLDAAESAREALRYFSMSWQLKGQQLLETAGNDETKRQYAGLLINRAEGLYELYNADPLWANG